MADSRNTMFGTANKPAAVSGRSCATSSSSESFSPQTIADILGDRSERPEGQGIPAAPSDGRYRFERQVAADRYYAAHLLGDLRDPRGVALLVPLLDDPETQSTVPWALGQIGDRRAIPPLVAALDDDDPSKRVLTIHALEAVDAKEAVPRLTTC